VRLVTAMDKNNDVYRYISDDAHIEKMVDTLGDPLFVFAKILGLKLYYCCTVTMLYFLLMSGITDLYLQRAWHNDHSLYPAAAILDFCHLHTRPPSMFDNNNDKFFAPIFTNQQYYCFVVNLVNRITDTSDAQGHRHWSQIMSCHFQRRRPPTHCSTDSSADHWLVISGHHGYSAIPYQQLPSLEQLMGPLSKKIFCKKCNF